MKTMRHILVVPALAAMLTGGAIISEARSLDTITLDCVFEHQNTSNVTDGKLTRDSNAQLGICRDYPDWERDGHINDRSVCFRGDHCCSFTSCVASR
jgi:hypothetical protein